MSDNPVGGRMLPCGIDYPSLAGSVCAGLFPD
jgi:hypothetical protein